MVRESNSIAMYCSKWWSIFRSRRPAGASDCSTARTRLDADVSVHLLCEVIPMKPKGSGAGSDMSSFIASSRTDET